MKLAEMKKKAACDYTLQDYIVFSLTIVGVVLCSLLDVVAFAAACAYESLCIALLIIPISALVAVLLALLFYIDPDW